jgi:2-dehydro-3-deoxyglucarate aldolase/4-hydroxy-2-oxoheptanedioate aldolase
MNQQGLDLSIRLKNKELLFGSHIFIGHPALTECMAQTGFDLLWICMEHTAIGHETLLNNLIAAKAGGTPAWVRIAWNDPVLAKPVLDMGADGIIFPYIRTVEDAKLAVAACTYPPIGIRGYGPLRAFNYGAMTQDEFVTTEYRKCARVIQIEHIDAVHNLREIAKVEGIDCFIVGPNDLSGSVGLLGQVRHPEMYKIYHEICAILRESGIPFGVATGYDKEWINEWKEMGATLFFCGMDYTFVQSGAANLLEKYKNDIKI